MEKLTLADLITYHSAAKHIDAVPRVMETNNSKQYFCGGTYCIDLFWYWANLPGFSGLMFWYGLDPNQTDKRFFVGAEPKFNFEYKETQTSYYSPSADVLIRPGDEFSYSIPGNREFEKFLKNHKLQIHFQDKFISNSEMKRFNNEFKNDPFYGKLQPFGFAYFHDKYSDSEGEKSFFRHFITQSDIKYLRFYLGYEKFINNNEEFEFLRLMLVPVDDKGKNTTVLKYPISPIFNQVMVLQKSWPPPPYA